MKSDSDLLFCSQALLTDKLNRGLQFDVHEGTLATCVVLSVARTYCCWSAYLQKPFLKGRSESFSAECLYVSLLVFILRSVVDAKIDI